MRTQGTLQSNEYKKAMLPRTDSQMETAWRPAQAQENQHSNWQIAGGSACTSLRIKNSTKTQSWGTVTIL